MALRGTLGDFGIADIFQLVGHQHKTGVLLLKQREIEVRISFVHGNVVKAEQSSRDRKDLLGNLMVRADVLTETQLEKVLSSQQRSMRRLGDILVETGLVDLETLCEFTRLQTTETIYRLFMWDSGSYEFTPVDQVDYDERTQQSIRAEELLMEAFRMVDEWPAVKEIIPSDAVTVTKAKELPPESSGDGGGDEDDLLSGLDDAFGEFEDDDDSAKEKGPEVGRAERFVYGYIDDDGNDVRKVIDRTRLGDFDATKALANLVQGGFVDVEIPQDLAKGGAGGSENARAFVAALPAIATRILLYAVVAAAVGGALKIQELSSTGLLAADRALVVQSGATQRAFGQQQMKRVRRAVEQYRLLNRKYPESLKAVVEAGLLEEESISHPYRTEFAYRLTDGGFELDLPLR